MTARSPRCDVCVFRRARVDMRGVGVWDSEAGAVLGLDGLKVCGNCARSLESEYVHSGDLLRVLRRIRWERER